MYKRQKGHTTVTLFVKCGYGIVELGFLSFEPVSYTHLDVYKRQEIAGYGATGDAYHMTSPSPTGEAAAHAMKYAYEEAGLKPEQVNYICLLYTSLQRLFPLLVNTSCLLPLHKP